MEPQLMMLAYQVSPTHANKIQSAHIQLIIYIYI
jgi:hypothetical protein